ncbi:MED6-domain-containing protein, partial [Clavulina sp. PMI_390]
MATPADDHSEQSFYWAEFIHELAPLNARTAMQYFETSPWFHIDPPSNNQILRMQTTGMDLTGFNEAEQLRALIGIEFAVAVDQGPALFVIHKQRRAGPNEVYPLEAYYIINNYIQQAPSLYNLISTRLNASVHHMMTSMSTLKSQKPPFTPTKGHTWPI